MKMRGEMFPEIHVWVQGLGFSAYGVMSDILCNELHHVTPQYLDCTVLHTLMKNNLVKTSSPISS